MAKEHILVTGATGAFGRYIARSLVARGENVTLLIRAENDAQARRRAETEAGLATDKVTALAGDLAKPNLGLSPKTYSALTQNITAILHLAASTRFDLSLDEARLRNFETTKNILAFAGQVQPLHKFGYVSTAFVAGRQTGVISETPQDGAAGFVNSYDQSKFEAETLVRSRAGTIPTAIYRPSLIVAPDSPDNHAAILVLKLTAQGLLPILPGEPEDFVDLISANEASEAIARLFKSHFSNGSTYHIASGSLSPTLGSLIEITRQPDFEVTYAGHDARNYDAAVRRLVEKRPELAPLYAKIDCYIKYLAYPKQFDKSQADKVLETSLGSDDVLRILEHRFSRAVSYAA